MTIFDKIMKYITILSCFILHVYCQTNNILSEFSSLEKQISTILEDPSLQGIEEAMHFMNLYCMEMSNLSLKLDQDMAGDMMEDLIKLYKQGRPKFIDIELNDYELKKYLLVKDKTLTKLKVLQSDARSIWDEFVTSLIKKSDKPI
uniref:Uncharacterized protein n=1 Tax=Cuerna arida TaxID=1464854 RepID=A0A1B6FSE8_9HEMI